MKNFIYLFLAFFFLCPKFYAQGEMGIFFSPRLYQQTLVQPAYYPDAKLHFALPQFSLQVEHAGFKPSDLIQPIAGSDSFQIDPEQALAALPDHPFLRTQASVAPFLLGFRAAGLHFSVSARSRAHAYLGYPADLLRLAWEGNQDKAGEQLDLGPDLQAQAYQELGLGVAIPMGPNLRLGIRAKYLAGFADLSVVDRELELTTQPEYYQLSARANYRVRSSQLTFDSLTSGSSEAGLVVQPFSSNWGLATDIGLIYQTKKWQLSASLIDYGYIQWRDNASELSLEGEAEFEGLDAYTFFTRDSGDFQVLADSLLDNFTIEEEEIESYTTFLPSRTYLGATYHLPFNARIGGLAQFEFLRGQLRHAYMVSFSKDFLKFLTLGVNYSVRNGQFDQVGANALLKLGPVVLAASSDNVLPFIQPKEARFTNIRLGMNFMFR